MSISLEALTMFNFKSFKGQIEIPIFSFAAIVGPNGSGKSNIMDAIAFVMGENSRALRVTCLKELIHGASIGKPIADSAHVTVAFTINNNERKIFTRRIYGDGSQYEIDDQIVTCKAYTTKLKEYGLDISGNFLLYQGSVECIAMKTPRELTRMFEQFSGSYVYKEDYDKLKAELAEVKNEVHFMHRMKKQILKEKKYSMAEKAEMEKYQSLQKQYMKEKSKLQYIRLFLIEKAVEAIEDKRKDIKSKIDEYLSDQKAAIDLFKRKRAEFKLLSQNDSLKTVEEDVPKLKNAISSKKEEHAVIKENILYWQKKRDCVLISLDTANKAYDDNKRIIQELKNELQQLDHMLAQETSQESTIELSNSQVKRYLDLKNKVECRATDFIKQINQLMHNRQTEQDKLDNVNRAKQEQENKIKLNAMMKEESETRLKKLQSLSIEFKATLTEKIAKRQELSKAINKMENKTLFLKSDIAKVLEELGEAHVDKHIISQQMKKSETITMLKQLFSGVYGRFSDFCKPIHPRYNVAVIKVLGKNMDAVIVDNERTAKQCIQFLKEQRIGVETFLPLDSLKLSPLMQHLRDIQKPSNVKLLYNVITTSSTEIDKAVLFVTKNTLVCETAEDARIMAYETNKRIKYDCVSLDGCFYGKNGMISGGKVDLMIRAKQWENKQTSVLMERKAQLTREFKDLPNVSLMQSEFNQLDIEIKELNVRIKHIEYDIKNSENKIIEIHKESTIHDMELSVLNETISKTQHNIQTRDAEIADIEKHVNAIEDEIFADFCRDINVPNINYYQKNNLRIHQERKTRQFELRKQYDYIQNQLNFENDRDIESKILKWKHIMEQADVKLREIHEQEHFIKSTIDQEETDLSKLQDECATIRNNLAKMEKETAQYKSQIDIISKLYLQAQKEHIFLQREIKQKKAQRNNILKECEIEDITIAILPDRLHDIRRLDPGTSTSNSSLNVESSNDWEASYVVDYSKLSEDILNNTKENLQGIVKEFEEKLAEIKNKIEAIENPNFKAEEKINSLIQQIQEINKKYKDLRSKCFKIETQFTTVKKKRYQLFSDCLEHVALEIDSIYKDLFNNTSAQVFILSDNAEEPYEGNINYNCIAPFKHFRPLQNLSGGEKTFASLALLFAFHRYKPIPFFVMDEADAALDKKNTKNLARFIQSQSGPTSFIIISLQHLSYVHANVLIGITMEPDAECPKSAMFTISLDKYRWANPEMA